jgi:hypothetical protein
VREKEAAAAAAAPAPAPLRKKGGKKGGAGAGAASARRPSSELLEARRKLVELKKKARAIVWEVDAEGAASDKWNVFGAGKKAPSTGRAACAPVAGAMAQRERDDASAKIAAAAAAAASADGSAAAAAPSSPAAAAPANVEDDDDGGIEAEDIACSACGRYDSDDRNDILICDYAYCGCAFHQACCDPPLAVLPPEDVDWCCPRVSAAAGGGGVVACAFVFGSARGSHFGP